MILRAVVLRAVILRAVILGTKCLATLVLCWIEYFVTQATELTMENGQLTIDNEVHFAPRYRIFAKFYRWSSVYCQLPASGTGIGYNW